MASSSETDLGYPHPPSPNPNPTVIIVFISFGCLALFGAFVACIWWFMKRRKEKKLIHERKDIDVDEHLKVQEMIVPGPCGPKKVLLSVEDDVRVHEDVHKNEIDMVGKGLHREHKDGVANAVENSGGSVASSSSQKLTLAEHQV